MHRRRRDVLKAGAALATAVGVAGCNAAGDDESGDGDEPDDTETDEPATSTDTPDGNDETESSSEESLAAPQAPGVETAVAAEWNAMRARLWDAVALGHAGATGQGAALTQAVFQRFEEAGGEYGAHEMLEATDEEAYESFEEALGELRTAGLAAGDLERAGEEAAIADSQLATAQRQLVDESTMHALSMQLFGANARNVAMLAATGNAEAASEMAATVSSRFEEAPAHDALESADSEAYESFEAGLDGARSAAENGDAEAVQTEAAAAVEAALTGSYALAGDEAAAGAGHIALVQAMGWDGAAIAGMGGPGAAFAHAVTLTTYRARVYDAQWLAARDEFETAASMVADIFAHFEGARAHEGLEAADHEAYEAFEAGLSDLQSALDAGDTDAIADAVATVDSSLVTGIGALAGSAGPLLSAAFVRTRIADAVELYRRGDTERAAAIGQSVFERFEANELDFHETLEDTSEQLYERFEHEHLEALVEAFDAGDEAAVQTHRQGITAALLEFERQAGSAATAAGTEAAYVASRGFDAAVLDTLGASDRAGAIGQSAFEHFESDPAGYHETLEESDGDLYEQFESRLEALLSATDSDESVYAAAQSFYGSVLDSAYATVAAAGGSQQDVAAELVSGTFAHFEEARVHERLEETDRSAYHTFEAALDEYITAAENGEGVTSAAATFADGAQYAQFALVDSVEKLPLELTLAGLAGEGGHDEGGHGGEDSESSLEGGPNVVEGVPDDADHVVDMTAVAFEPAELTISAGDTVAWTHAGGEPHSVTAYEEKIPDDATYWTSGDFDSQSAAVEGWENGSGAVQSGESYVRTFETTGTHEYYCIPHEAAGMVGKIVVE